MTELQKILSWNMKLYRKKALLSQSDLANRIQSASTYISQIERGKRFPSPKMIERIAKVLDVAEFELFTPEKMGRENSFDLYQRLQQGVLEAIREAFK